MHVGVLDLHTGRGKGRSMFFIGRNTARVRHSPWKWATFGLLAWGVMSGAMGCRSTPAEPVERSRSRRVEEIPIIWQESGTYSRLTRPTRLLVRDRAALVRVPLTEVPVDFETQMVLVCGLGPTPDDRRGVRIARVWREGSVIRVQERTILSEREPRRLERASPWTVAIIPRSDANVEGYQVHTRDGLFGR